MDLNTVASIVCPKSPAELPSWTAGDAWLAGGTWLYSEPQVHLSRLIDLQTMGWPALTITNYGLEIAATCTIAELDAFVAPPDWKGASLIAPCCRAFLASFKIWKTATVGGNLCLALPAGPMISLTAALDGECVIWSPNRNARRISVIDFIMGSQQNALQPGELLRSIHLPFSALRRTAAFRQISLTPVGRSAALLIGTHQPQAEFQLIVTASTKRPIRLAFAQLPTAQQLREVIIGHIHTEDYQDDVHGKPEWRREMTLLHGEEIRAELESPA